MELIFIEFIPFSIFFKLTGGNEKGALAAARRYLEAFYCCKYDELFVVLAQLENEYLKLDRYLTPHYSFYSRAMRLKAYEQFISPYKTVFFIFS